ncbi:MAG: response regulator [Capsulimonadales bacterium]|nr:response regulator [Capsulimonadales bacterium]
MLTDLKNAAILVVDDEKPNVRFLEIILEEAGFTCVRGTTDSRETLPLCRSLRPDLILLDLHMPYPDGLTLLAELAEAREADPVPVLVLTADTEATTRYKALNAGADDFLTKPLDEQEVLLRIRNLLRIRFHHVLLEEKVRERTDELHLAHLDSLRILARAGEYRDDVTGLHAERVGVTSACIADAMGYSPEYVDMILRAAPLHDIGKIGIADAILRKPGPLTPEEFEVMKQHTTIGAKILAGTTSPILRIAEEIALYHHERWDGDGYYGLAGEEIPLPARIVSVADHFDALTHDRPYKEAWTVAEAVRRIEEEADRHFDRRVVEAFATLSHQDLM